MDIRNLLPQGHELALQVYGLLNLIMQLSTQLILVIAHTSELVFERVFDPRKLDALQQHVALDLVGLSLRGVGRLFVDATVEFDFFQVVF